MKYKQPRSVQVVVYSEGSNGRQYLLLKRLESHGGFWQSVTGSLEEGESHAAAAIREVREETGIIRPSSDLIDLCLVNTFEIAPLWRRKYAPGVTHNEEVCFALKVDKCEIRIDPSEHVSYTWVCFENAIEMLYWNSSKRAFAALERLLDSLMKK